MYDDNGGWEREFAKASHHLDEYRGKLESLEAVEKALDHFFESMQRIERLYTYAHQRNDEDLANDSHQAIYQRAMLLHHTFSEESSWLQPELLNQSKEILEGFSEALPKYRFFFEKLVRLKQHTLSPREEEIIAMAGKALSSPSNTFSLLTNADFRFGTVEDSSAKAHELTQGSYAVLLRNPDRTLRENAFKKIHGHFGQHENTLCELLHGQVQGHLFEARTHNFTTALDAALYPKNIDTNVYRSLISAVRERLPVLHKYMRVRKEMLGVDELHLWDVYVPLVGGVEEKIDYDTGAKLVIEAVAPLGQEYQETLAKGLTSERWVDRYENENKRSGAYSSGCYDSYPYILMNYKGLLRDVATLAHEAGHSMHSYLSHKHQTYHDSHYSIFVAEVASTFNEELLFRILLDRAETKEKRLYLINQKLDDIRATLFRQTMFAEFELLIHEMAERGEPITPGVLKEKYHALNADYFGPDVVIDEEIAIEWARIPHFYYNYYVYQYATGVSAALSLAERVLSGGDQEREDYLSFLKGGGSKFPIDLLKSAGVDMTKPEPVHQAIDTFDNLVAQLSET